MPVEKRERLQARVKGESWTLFQYKQWKSPADADSKLLSYTEIIPK